MSNIIVTVGQTLGGLYLIVCILRVLLQACRASYYNPVSQFVVKATRVPAAQLGNIVPKFGRIDIAGILWILIAHTLYVELMAYLLAQQFINPLQALSWATVGSLNLLLLFYYYGMFIVIIVGFLIALGGLQIRHPALDLLEEVVRPALAPIQRIIPPMGGLDLSPIFFFLAIYVARELLTQLAVSLRLAPAVVIGF